MTVFFASLFFLQFNLNHFCNWASIMLLLTAVFSWLHPYTQSVIERKGGGGAIALPSFYININFESICSFSTLHRADIFIRAFFNTFFLWKISCLCSPFNSLCQCTRSIASESPLSCFHWSSNLFLHVRSNDKCI